MKPPGIRLTCLAGLMAMAFSQPGGFVHAQAASGEGVPLRMDTSLNMVTRVSNPSISPLGLAGAGDEVIPEPLTIIEPGTAACRDLSPSLLKRLTLMDTVQHVLCKTPLYNQSILLVAGEQQRFGIAERQRYGLTGGLLGTF